MQASKTIFKAEPADHATPNLANQVLFPPRFALPLPSHHTAGLSVPACQSLRPRGLGGRLRPIGCMPAATIVVREQGDIIVRYATRSWNRRWKSRGHGGLPTTARRSRHGNYVCGEEVLEQATIAVDRTRGRVLLDSSASENWRVIHRPGDVRQRLSASRVHSYPTA